MFIGVCMNEGDVYILSEYMCGGNVERILKDENMQLPLYMRMIWAMDVVVGMQWLHDYKPNPILHRDLKTANLLIDEHNRVKGWICSICSC